jgi:hypothetical protein
MRNIVGRLIIWVAEILDRNLFAVPDVDVFDGEIRHPRERSALAESALR